MVGPLSYLTAGAEDFAVDRYEIVSGRSEKLHVGYVTIDDRPISFPRLGGMKA
jgi:hypothetical protein